MCNLTRPFVFCNTVCYLVVNVHMCMLHVCLTGLFGFQVFVYSALERNFSISLFISSLRIRYWVFNSWVSYWVLVVLGKGVQYSRKYVKPIGKTNKF